MLDVKRMRILKEVSDRGSFSAAAEALSYTQSAVSQQIAALEREAGTQLVTRGARGIRLTEGGEAAGRAAAGGGRRAPRPPRRPDPHAPGGRRGRAPGDRGAARRPAPLGGLPDSGRDADAARDRHVP